MEWEKEKYKYGGTTYVEVMIDTHMAGQSLVPHDRHELRRQLRRDREELESGEVVRERREEDELSSGGRVQREKVPRQRQQTVF